VRHEVDVDDGVKLILRLRPGENLALLRKHFEAEFDDRSGWLMWRWVKVGFKQWLVLVFI